MLAAVEKKPWPFLRERTSRKEHCFGLRSARGGSDLGADHQRTTGLSAIEARGSFGRATYIAVAYPTGRENQR